MGADNWLELNKELHRRAGDYGAGSVRYATPVIQYIEEFGCTTVLDYGCGKGGLVRSLKTKGIQAEGYDPAVPRFETMPSGSFDMITCTDVMEHVYEPCVPEVFATIASHNPNVIYFVIVYVNGPRMLEDGTPAHCNVHPPEWWEKKLEDFYGDDYDIRKPIIRMHTPYPQREKPKIWSGQHVLVKKLSC
jgi:hypothetical protein